MIALTIVGGSGPVGRCRRLLLMSRILSGWQVHFVRIRMVSKSVTETIQQYRNGMIETVVVDSHAQHGPHAEGGQGKQFHTL